MRILRVREHHHGRGGDEAVRDVEHAPFRAFALEPHRALAEAPAHERAGAGEARRDEASRGQRRAAGKPPPAAAHGVARDRARARAIDELEELRRIGERSGDGGEARGLVIAFGKLQHAAALPGERLRTLREVRVVLQRVEKGAARDLSVHRIAQVGDRPHEPDRRGARAELLVHEVHVPAANGERVRGERSREPSADDHRAPLAWRLPDRRIGAVMSREHLALAPEAVALLEREAGVAKRGASSRTTSGDHIAGFLAGANPSGKNASARATSCFSIACASPMRSVNATRPSSKRKR